MTTQFIETIRQAGMKPPATMSPGLFHRFPGVGKPEGNTSGWAYLLRDGLAGSFGCWATGMKRHWTDDGMALTPKQRQQLFARIRKAEQKEQRQKRVRQKRSAKTAQRIWDASEPVLFHDYLKRKQVLPHGIRQYAGETSIFQGCLIIPVYADGGMVSIQSIAADGTKRFLKNGRMMGGHYRIGDEPTDALYICEGFATGASLYQALKVPVVVAFNANNLRPVALHQRKRYPHAKITLAADNDYRTEGNPGLTKAKGAAALVGASVIYADFDELGNPEGATDFNDNVCLGGKL